MIIVCPSCQARYRFDESKLGTKPRAKTKCAKCGGAIEIENPALGAATLPPPPTTPPPARAPEPPADENTRKSKILRATGASATTSHDLIGDSSNLSMSEGKRYSLAVIQGAATGHIYSLTKPRTLMGRSGSDINLEDAEASRQHAALEILGDHAILRDLGSTNGTFVDSSRIQQQVLTNQMEFRIGTHVLMFIVTDVE